MGLGVSPDFHWRKTMLKINIRKEFKKDWISREAGERLRMMILEADQKGEAIQIDFGNKMIASTSFFDEGFAKLTESGWTEQDLVKKIKFVDIHPQDERILKTLCKNRKMG